ncbi:hypothetical protein Taro_043459 [Colocasia esculenta]|uniref:Bromo domain-containing protein n=1 Tax=Colocasia esculenta TaxID=4460 RepID=A0A843X0R4_COLES|nr:hypothetical protein [Colocasia esculenta]
MPTAGINEQNDFRSFANVLRRVDRYAVRMWRSSKVVDAGDLSEEYAVQVAFFVVEGVLLGFCRWSSRFGTFVPLPERCLRVALEGIPIKLCDEEGVGFLGPEVEDDEGAGNLKCLVLSVDLNSTGLSRVELVEGASSLAAENRPHLRPVGRPRPAGLVALFGLNSDTLSYLISACVGTLEGGIRMTSLAEAERVAVGMGVSQIALGGLGTVVPSAYILHQLPSSATGLSVLRLVVRPTEVALVFAKVMGGGTRCCSREEEDALLPFSFLSKDLFLCTPGSRLLAFEEEDAVTLALLVPPLVSEDFRAAMEQVEEAFQGEDIVSDDGSLSKGEVVDILSKVENYMKIQSDVFLVCTNAMEYNAPDTIYFRQARSIQELARKKFQTVRFERENAVKPEQNVQSSSVTKKTINPLCKAAQDPTEPMFHKSSAATLASNGKTCTELNAVQPSEQPVILEGCIDGNFSENKSEKGDDSSVLAKSLINLSYHVARSSPVKVGKKPITLDEDHRATYNAVNELPDDQSDSLFAILENEPKHLVAVGLDAEYSYARSLARFAGTLGPIAWRIASENIEKALPTGVKFGPGWVGEYEPLPTPVLSFESHSQQHSSHHGLFKHNAENRKNSMIEVQRKSTQSVATGTVQLFPRTPSDLSTTGAIGVKVNHVKDLPVLTSSKDQSDARVGTSILDKSILHNSSPMMGKIADVSARRPEQCAEILASRLDFVTSGSKNIVQSCPKQSQMVPHQPKSSTSCMDTRGTSNGKDVGTLFGNSRPSPLGFFPPNQMTPGNSCFSHADRMQAINDPVEVRKVTSGRILNKISSSESLVTDNHKLVTPTVPSPRSNSSAAATAAARAWMSVGRSSEHKPVENSRHLNMEVGCVDAGNLTAESHAHASGIHDDGMKGSIMPSVFQLPSKVAAEECQTPHKHVTAFPQLVLTELSRYPGQTPWRGLVPHVQQKQRKDVCPPDLNISFHSPGSPVLQSGILVDSQQPDLALQL